MLLAHYMMTQRRNNKRLVYHGVMDVENNMDALTSIVVIWGEDAPTTRSTGAAQWKQTTRFTKGTWRREEEDISK